MSTYFARLLELATTGLVVLAVFLALLWWLNLLDRFMSRRLVRSLGWSGWLMTGWIGTPVHEGSHVLACWLFGHRVDRVAWFQPDPAAERLGYVQHSYDRRNWFQEIGNLFIALAPLVGGGLATLILLKLCFPEIHWEPAATPLPNPTGSWWSTLWQGLRSTGQAAGQVVAQVVAPPHWTQPRFWLFAYLATCLACHAAPSRADYASAVRGVLLCGGCAAASLAVASLGVTSTRWAVRTLETALELVAAYAVIASAVSLFGLVVVVGVTALADGLRAVTGRGGSPSA